MAVERKTVTARAREGNRPAHRRSTTTLAIVDGLLCGVVLALIQYAVWPPPKAPAPKPATAAAPPIVQPPPDTGPEAEFRRLVQYGDLCYDEAVTRLKRSDPAQNPTGWDKENAEALRLLDRAAEHYQRALDLRNTGSLQDRVRDVNFKRALARRRKLER